LAAEDELVGQVLMKRLFIFEIFFKNLGALLFVVVVVVVVEDVVVEVVSVVVFDVVVVGGGGGTQFPSQYLTLRSVTAIF